VRASAALALDDRMIVGVGEPLARALGRSVDGLRGLPRGARPRRRVPSTQGARGLRGRHRFRRDPPRARRIAASLGDYVRLDEDIPSFVTRRPRSLRVRGRHREPEG